MFLLLVGHDKGVSYWDGMQSLQPNENASRNLWIKFLETDWQGDFGEAKRWNEEDWRHVEKVKVGDCGVIKGKLSDWAYEED